MTRRSAGRFLSIWVFYQDECLRPGMMLFSCLLYCAYIEFILLGFSMLFVESLQPEYLNRIWDTFLFESGALMCSFFRFLNFI